MKILRLLPIVLTFLFVLSPAAAQETLDTGWPIEERCLVEPTPPPDDWTFSGAILMTGRYGIHAVTEDVPTPYVVAFINQAQVIGLGGLSPNGRWYAVLLGQHSNSSITNVSTQQTSEIRVYSTINSREIYTIPWDNFDSVVGFSGAWDQLLWLDNEHLLYPLSDGEASGIQLINPFTGIFETWNEEPIQTAYFSDLFIPSPDLNHAIYDTTAEQHTKWAISDEKNTIIFGDPSTFINFAWTPDSTGFMAEKRDTASDSLQYQLVLFDNQGNEQEMIIKFASGETLREIYGRLIKNIGWSPDGRYLAFVTTTFADPTINLYIADIQEERVYDTCVETSDGLAWSPDSNMLAMMDFYDYKPHRPVMVLDLDNWALHTVAYHAGSVIGWRED